MSIQNFIQNENIQMLWDVISDENIFRFLTPDIQSKIYQLFINNIKGFYEVENSKTNLLVDLNKKYILLILNHIKKTYPYQPNKIKIHNEQPTKELITYEEIHNDRKSQFDKDFTRKQEEFEDSMSIKAPPVPEFADKYTDRPIKEMDKILKEMQAQRNYEVEQINRNPPKDINKIDNWLKPQETSLKSEKNYNIDNHEEKVDFNNHSSRFKFLNLEEQISPTNSKKNVSFSNKDEINTFDIEDEDDNTIFSKLKKKNVENKKENINLQIYEPNYNEINYNEDRIAKLERNINKLNDKMDEIITILNIKKLI